MATRLDVYKQAELHIGKSTITALTDVVEARYKFDQAWLGVVEEAFSEGDWNFAKKTSSITATAGVPIDGWAYSFDYPADYLRTVSMAPYAAWRGDFYDFADQGGGLYANTQNLTITYISSASVSDPTKWPTMFWRYVALKLAYETCEALTNGTTKQADLEKRLKKALRQAKSVDARNENNKRPKVGSWMRSRHGWGGSSSPIVTTLGGEIVPEEGDV
ncbi:hypothetical protein CYG48_05040 [Neorhizobium sp. SOG26]|uniref:hypothetical protein n=1 Tax=Neorhizobium sp. SOG26 TaxID=2060726 RepID=UPI000E568873|nr:hypothetical protein [Neorhizobium sp. SOG26]AXV15119.1 hypothetical protein CYG48_05040 [Neorhizobium sp. SOG26]